MINIILAIYLASGFVDLGVANHLASGERAISRGQWETAIVHFEKAIASGRLNEPGYIMTYWNIHSCYEELGDENQSAEALFAFIVHAEMVLEYDRDYMIRWVAQFGIKERLKYARVLLSAYWAKRNNYSCRSKLMACYLPAMRFLEPYVENLFCGSKVLAKEEDGLIVIRPECDNSKYYFYK